MPTRSYSVNSVDRRRILLVATVDFHFTSFHLPVMSWFQDQGLEVHVAACGTLVLPYCDQRFNLPFQRSPFSCKNIQAYKELKRIIDDNDYALIHCHTPVGGLLGRLAARATRKRGTKVLYTAHGFHFCKEASLVNWLLYYPVERFLARYTDCLITIAEDDFLLARRHCFPAGRIEHVPGVGVDANTYAPLDDGERDRRRRQFGYTEDEFLLFYAAEFNSNKNQAMLIRAVATACKATPGLRLLLAGNGALWEECQALAKKLNVAEQIDFLGYRQDLSDLLPLCDIAVASSRREGLPVNVMEAMSCGLPVVATANRGHRELVVDKQTGQIVQPDDYQAMSEAITWLADNPGVRKSMGAAGRQCIVQRYALPVAIGAMKSVYGKLLITPMASER